MWVMNWIHENNVLINVWTNLGDVEEVEKLLKEGVDPNVKDDSGTKIIPHKYVSIKFKPKFR